MTHIKLTDDMRLVVTQSGTIYRGDNMSTSIVFLLPANVDGLEVGSSTVFLNYIRPDGTPDIAILKPESTMYNQSYHRYILPVTCKISRYPGPICMWLELYTGSPLCPNVKKSGECVIQILNANNIDNCLSDHQLTALYQLKKQVESFRDESTDSDSSTGTEGSAGDSSDSETENDGFKVVEF